MAEYSEDLVKRNTHMHTHTYINAHTYIHLIYKYIKQMWHMLGIAESK